MSHPNRVQPDGAFLATSARGTMMGNRGILHRNGMIGAARWKHRAWVCCKLDFKGRHRDILQPGTWTELFFFDEAVALAAGHRPCGECRKSDYDAFTTAWAERYGSWPGPKAADATLHAARAERGARHLKTHQADIATLPDGAFFRSGGFMVVWRGAAYRYTPDGYGPGSRLPTGIVDVLTNPITLSIISAGYRPQIHDSLEA